MEKAPEMDTLTDIIIRYDLCLLQEIKDSSGDAVQALLNQCNSKVSVDNQYKLIVGPRVGENSQATEQYAYIYKPKYFSLLQSYSYPDPNNDFSRDPFIAQFRVISSGYTFAMIGLHTPPENTIAELTALPSVQKSATATLNEPNIVMLGDFNADTPNISAKSQTELVIFNSPDYISLISTEVDTTTSHSTTDPTAYDRIVITRSFDSRIIPLSANSFDFEAAYGLSFDFAYEVSDHYPVFVQIQGTSSSPSSAAATWTQLYSANFNGVVGPEWDKTQTTTSNGKTFLGKFGENDAVKLTLKYATLPPVISGKTTQYKVTFLFHAIGTWNGAAPSGPDTFKVQYYGSSSYNVLYEGIFCNSDPNGTDRQSWPTDQAPTQQNRCGTGNVNNIAGLGYTQYNSYAMTESFNYKLAADLVIRFSGQLLSSTGYESIDSESWGIDDVIVSYTYNSSS